MPEGWRFGDSKLPEGWSFPIGCGTAGMEFSVEKFLSGVLNEVNGYTGGALGNEPKTMDRVGEEQCSAIFTRVYPCPLLSLFRVCV